MMVKDDPNPRISSYNEKSLKNTKHINNTDSQWITDDCDFDKYSCLGFPEEFRKVPLKNFIIIILKKILL